ncbi:GapA-binding peptide SR1P [Ectobacillus sp. sgz5001026]
MGTIVCQVCESTIEHFEDEKVTVLYGHCCEECASDTHKHVEV